MKKKKMWLINLSQYDDYGFVLFSTLEKAQAYERTFDTSEPEEIEVDPDFVALPDGKRVWYVSGTITNFPDWTRPKRFKPDAKYPTIYVENVTRTIVNPAGFREEIRIGHTANSFVYIDVIADSRDDAIKQAKQILAEWMVKNEVKILGTEKEIDDFIAKWNDQWLDDMTKKMGI